MAKSAPKSGSKQKANTKAIDKKKKLPRGYKQCGNCKRLLHIHRYVCDDCGFKHDMKKKKKDILKNLNKITPKLLRSLIQLNDFNAIQPENQQRQNQIFPHSMLSKTEFSVPQDIKKRKSSKMSNKSQQIISHLNWKAANNNGSYVKLNSSLVCMCAVLDDILIAQSIEKTANLSASQNVTMKAYKLQKYHKFGQIYTGKCLLHYIKGKKIHYQISINQHIINIKSLNNRVGMLTGRGTVLVADLEIKPLKNANDRPFELHDSIEVKANPEDHITVFQWLKNDFTAQIVKIITGTLMGHICIYKIVDKTVQLIRFICNAHFESITAISQCPLSNNDQCLFATGSYDGALSVWSLNQKEPIYTTQASNRKISHLMWDCGAKFIFVVRDQNQDSGVLACFFAISKNDESVTLSDQIDFRLIKNTANCKILSQSDSNKIYLIDTVQSTLKEVEIQQLRKNSLKRKKVKKQDQQKLFKINFSSDKLEIQDLDLDSQAKEQHRLNQTNLYLPTIADVCQNTINGVTTIWGITYDGFLFTVQMK